MAYIGKEPIVGNFQKCDALNASATADYTLQVSSTNVVPESANHMLVSLNGVIQEPGATGGFTVSGSTLSFTSALTSNDTIDFVILLGNVLDIGTPSDATVTNAKLAQDIISGETELAAIPDTTDEFLISNAGVLNRIDAQFFQNTPAFEAYLAADGGQGVSDATTTTVAIETEIFDAGGCFNNTGGSVALNGISVPAYSFLPNVAGKYFVYGGILTDTGTNSNIEYVDIFLYDEADNVISQTRDNFLSNPIRQSFVQIQSVIDMDGTSNAVYLRGRINSTDGNGQLFEAYPQWRRGTYFGAYKIIGA